MALDYSTMSPSEPVYSIDWTEASEDESTITSEEPHSTWTSVDTESQEWTTTLYSSTADTPGDNNTHKSIHLVVHQ